MVAAPLFHAWGYSHLLMGLSRNDTVVYGRRGTLWLSGSQVVLHSPERPVEGAEPVEWQGFKDCYRVAPRAEIRPESMIEHFATCIREKRE